MVKFEDNRENSKWVPAIPILEEFIPKINQKHFIGIKKIVLLDNDYHKDNETKAFARYIPINGTKHANIEFYLDSLSDLPDEAKKSLMYIAWRILRALAHEVYHHRIRGQKIVRRPKFKKEQKDADSWAAKLIKPIFLESYPAEKYSKEWDHIEQIIREHLKSTI